MHTHTHTHTHTGESAARGALAGGGPEYAYNTSAPAYHPLIGKGGWGGGAYGQAVPMPSTGHC